MCTQSYKSQDIRKIYFLIFASYIEKLPEITLNPKRAGLFGPISQPGGGGGFRPPKISETDWRNIKCVVLVDSYDPPESIGTKKKYKHTLYDVTVTS